MVHRTDTHEPSESRYTESDPIHPDTYVTDAELADKITHNQDVVAYFERQTELARRATARLVALRDARAAAAALALDSASTERETIPREQAYGEFPPDADASLVST